MKIQLNTLEQVEAFIANANQLLGYPDGRGTETYCNVPEPSEDGTHEIEITQELNEAMIKLATEQLIKPM